jgi:uncharacterized protein YbjT (DUF2867 family)
METKNVIIIGAGGSLAKYVVDELKKYKQIHLTLFLRNKRRLQDGDFADCKILEGNVLDYEVLKNAIAGQDIVYVNLAGDLNAMARNIVKAMNETGVKRIIAISSIGIYDDPLRPILIPYKSLADIIESSDLDYTILRPTWFTNANEVDYEITHKGEPEKGSVISRRSIEAFISKIIQAPEKYVHESLGINKPNS